MANKKYKLSNSDYWEASGVYDITEGKTQREVNAALKGSLNTKIKYYHAQSVGTGTNVELFRITDTDINTATIVIALEIIDPDNITSSINWQSYNGYISFIGTCKAATTANVVLANR